MSYTTYMWYLKINDTNEQTYEREGDLQTWSCGCQGRREMKDGRMGSSGLADANYYLQDE